MREDCLCSPQLSHPVQYSQGRTKRSQTRTTPRPHVIQSQKSRLATCSPIVQPTFIGRPGAPTTIPPNPCDRTRSHPAATRDLQQTPRSHLDSPLPRRVTQIRQCKAGPTCSRRLLLRIGQRPSLVHLQSSYPRDVLHTRSPSNAGPIFASPPFREPIFSRAHIFAVRFQTPVRITLWIAERPENPSSRSRRARCAKVPASRPSTTAC